MAYAVNTTDAEAAKRHGRVRASRARPRRRLLYRPGTARDRRGDAARWLAKTPRLAYLDHYVDNLFRKQAHVRSAEVEELLGMVADPFANVETPLAC